jgi:type IV secretion system protein VirB6
MMQSPAKILLRYISVLMIFVSINQNIAKADAITDIVQVISTLTCETEGIGNLLTGPFTHTCIQEAFSTMVVGSLVSPGIYPAMMLRLRIDDDNVKPGNCLRRNRADPARPSLTFGMCSNLRLVAYRAQMIAQFTASLGSGAPSLDSLASMVDSANYTEVFRDKHDGDSGWFYDVPLGPGISVFPWQVMVHGDRICVEIMSLSGWMSVGCKYIAEPYPRSIYGSFFNNESYSGTDVYIPPEMAEYLSCATSGGCAYRAAAASHAAISISATIMQCVSEMLTKLLISQQVCNINSVNATHNINRVDSAFYQFQVNMHRTVMALLTLYVMFIGFKILLSGEELPKTGELIMYVMKLILVIYFSVGININGGEARFDGMTRWIFPLLMGASSEIATWVMNATPSGLCRFLPSDYPPDMGNMALWDALDCKVLHYIGIDVITTISQGQNSGDPLGNSIPPYVFLLIPAIYFKQINLVILAISYPLVVLSLAAYLVNSFVVCMIAISILGILAPIYVPMSLFDQTKGYFEGWYTLMISFVLQPVVVIGFMTLMFALYDMGFYGTCQYREMEMKVSDINNPREIRTKKLFIIDDDESHYDSPADYVSCQESIGYILNNPLGSLASGIAERSSDGTVDMSSTEDAQKNLANYMEEYGMLQGLTPVMGFFVGYFSLLSQLSWSMIVNLMTCCLLLYLMYELSSQLGEFAADIAQSVTLSGVISPRGLADKAMSAVSSAGKSMKKAGDSGGSDGAKAPSRPTSGSSGSGAGGGAGGGGLSPNRGDGGATPQVEGGFSGSDSSSGGESADATPQVEGGSSSGDGASDDSSTMNAGGSSGGGAGGGGGDGDGDGGAGGGAGGGGLSPNRGDGGATPQVEGGSSSSDGASGDSSTMNAGGSSGGDSGGGEGSGGGLSPKGGDGGTDPQDESSDANSTTDHQQDRAGTASSVSLDEAGDGDEGDKSLSERSRDKDV